MGQALFKQSVECAKVIAHNLNAKCYIHQKNENAAISSRHMLHATSYQIYVVHSFIIFSCDKNPYILVPKPDVEPIYLGIYVSCIAKFTRYRRDNYLLVSLQNLTVGTTYLPYCRNKYRRFVAYIIMNQLKDLFDCTSWKNKIRYTKPVHEVLTEFFCITKISLSLTNFVQTLKNKPF